jgi:uncharacterized protein (DUF4415 family)
MKSESSHSEERPARKRASTSKQSRTDWAALRSPTPDVSSPEHPEAAVGHVMRGVVRRGLKIQPPKTAVSLRIEQDVLECSRVKALATKHA